MKRLKFFITIIWMSFNSFIMAQEGTNSDLAEAKRAIAQSNAIYFQAFEKNDSSIFINRYAKDACIMMPGAPAICGSNAPLEFFKMSYHQFGLRNGNFITSDVFGSGKEYVTEVGLFNLYDSSHKIIDSGKYLVLWKKTSSGWKMFRDSFSSNQK